MIPRKTYFDHGVLSACNSMPALGDSDNTVELSLMQEDINSLVSGYIPILIIQTVVEALP